MDIVSLLSLLILPPPADATFSMNRKSPRPAKRVESAADVSYGIASVLRYVKTTTTAAKHVSGCTDPTYRRIGAMSSSSFSNSRLIIFNGRMCAQLTGKHFVIRHIIWNPKESVKIITHNDSYITEQQITGTQKRNVDLFFLTFRGPEWAL